MSSDSPIRPRSINVDTDSSSDSDSEDSASSSTINFEEENIVDLTIINIFSVDGTLVRCKANTGTLQIETSLDGYNWNVVHLTNAYQPYCFTYNNSIMYAELCDCTLHGETFKYVRVYKSNANMIMFNLLAMHEVDYDCENLRFEVHGNKILFSYQDSMQTIYTYELINNEFHLINSC